jgi:hypothetical protein
MNEQIKLIMDCLKEMRGKGHYQKIFKQIGVNFPSQEIFDRTLGEMESTGIIDKITKRKIIKLRAGLGANEERYYDIRLTIDESIIFYDFLKRVNENKIDLITEDQSEKRILWNIEGILEKKLVEPFQPDYESLVKACRNRMRDIQS